MRVSRRIPILLAFILIISVLAVWSGKSIEKDKEQSVESINKKTVTYLSSQGYGEDDYSLKIEYNQSRFDKKLSPYVIEVVFSDEPDVLYYYTYNYKYDGKITQSGISPMKDKKDKNFKHSEGNNP